MLDKSSQEPILPGAVAATPVPVAIVGVGALFPGSTDATGFWRDILGGKDLISDVPASRWLIEDHYDPDPTATDKTYCRRGGFLSPMQFDPLAFGLPPTSLQATDTTQILALIVARQLLEDALTSQFEAVDKSRMSVILGVTSGQELFSQLAGRLHRPQWLEGMRAAGIPEDEALAACDKIAETFVGWQESSFPGLLGNVVAGRIANRFNLGGTNCVVDAACASSHSALSMGLSELYLGTSDVVIAGGADTYNDIGMYLCFSKTPAFSPTGDCRPFSDDGDGTIIGEGLAMFALKRLADAERDNDRIYGVIAAIGSSSDGAGTAVYAPVAAGQARALRRTYDLAGFSPSTVELVEAHGTGTKAGDAAEFQGLRTAFAQEGASQWCALGSVKSQIGHTKATAGAAGLFKAVMALHHKVLPPTIKITRPNSSLSLADSPFYLNTAARPWIRGAAHPRRAGVSAFGFGGSNFHVALEEYTGAGQRAPRRRTMAAELVLLHGTADTLAARCRELAAGSLAPGGLAHLAHQSQGDFRSDAAARLAIVATDEADLATKARLAADAIAKAPNEAFVLPNGVAYSALAAEGEPALLFPGQGSQYVGMGADMAMAFDAARHVWDDAADLPYQPHMQVFPPPVFSDEARAAQQKSLTRTEMAQPAIGLASLALLAVLRDMGLEYGAAAGHSFGEVTALHAAGVLDAPTMMGVARRRGELMAEAAASKSGSMSAIDRPAAQVKAWLEAAGNTAIVANDNAPNQVVISGETAVVEAAEAILTGHGASVHRLPVATAFHSSVVADSVAPFGAYLGGIDFGRADKPIFANATTQDYPNAPAKMRSLLAGQIASPVRFCEMIEAMYAAGTRLFVEVGPGSVLTNLVGQILKDRPHRVIATDRKGQNGIVSFFNALAQLAAAGVPLNYQALWNDYAPPIDPASLPKPKFAVSLDGGNYARPYPPAKGEAKRLPNPPRPAPKPVAPIAVAAPAFVAPPVPVAAPAPAAIMEPVKMTSPSPAALPAGSLEAWQRMLTDGHIAYMKTMEQTLAEGHQAFLRAMEGTIAQPGAVVARPMIVEAPQPVALPPSPQAPVAAAPQPIAPAPAPVVVPVPAKAAAPAVDLSALLMEIVAEKTGYPVEVLDLSKSLEADLGIDSIKRVEILSAMQDRVPDLPPVDAKEMGKLRTLGEIVDAMGDAYPATMAAPAKAAAPSVDLSALLMEIVAEKTGYPVEVLDLSKSLEADLGIDSIKRVEILSAMQDRVPDLPPVDAKEMGKLRTLGEIVAAMGSATAPAPAKAAAPSVDLAGLLMEIVAEKTGYPVEVLDLSKSLEADLGIDSIKRVEILSAMQDRVPDLPPVDAKEMGKLRTLGEIVAAMGAATAPAPAKAAAPSVDLAALLMDIVAEKTGYPVEVLDLSKSLEADLGIDSIKRVEILSAMQDRVPDLPPVDAKEMGKLRTLGEIVAAMNSGAAPAAVSAAAPSAPVAKNAVDRLIVRAIEAPASGHIMLSKEPIVIAGESGALASALAGLLIAKGYAVEVRADVPLGTRQVIFLGLAKDKAGEDAMIELNRAAFQAARVIAVDPLMLVTVQDTGGAFGLGGVDGKRAYSGGLAGLVKTAAQEWSHARVKAIDLDRSGGDSTALAERLVGELLAGGPELEVGLPADGRRLTLLAERALLPESLAGSACLLGKDDVVVASGGARGVTGHTMVALAGASKARFVLLGRTPLTAEPACCKAATDENAVKLALIAAAKAAGGAIALAEIGAEAQAIMANREVEATLAAIRAAGGDARYASVDIRDPQAVGAVLVDVRRDWGPITAMVHGAGVLADKLIADKTVKQFDSVLSTKIDGLRALLLATANDPLRAICLFSSVAARAGNSGQSDYAMANEMLNKVAQAEAARRGDGCRVKSLNWGPWAGGMVSPSLAAHFERQGVALLPIADGARMLVDEFRIDAPADVEVVIGSSLPTSRLGSTLRLHVDAHSHPQLDGHRIRGTVVLPAMQIMEWFVRAASAQAPGWHLGAIEGFSVLKGITLESFDEAGQTFDIQVQVDQADDRQIAMSLELVGPTGRLHYAASAVMLRTAPSAPKAPTVPALPAAPWQQAEIYESGLLFHRGPFQAVAKLEGLSAEGGLADLLTDTALDWPTGTPAIDIAVLDGGLQLALLHGALAIRQISLPTSVAAFRLYAAPSWSGPVRCQLSGKALNNMTTRSDLSFVSADGQVVAEIIGLEMHMYEDLPTAAARAIV